MRKQVFGRRFKRDANQRKALFSGLISAMILKGKITTTEHKAKAIKGDLEKLVTKAKKGEEAKLILSKNLKPFELERMISVIAPIYKDRNGGYTRIIKKGKRLGDSASTAILEFVDLEKIIEFDKAKKDAKTASKKTKKESKKTESPKKKLSLKKEKVSSKKESKSKK